MSDGNFNRNLLPLTLFQSGYRSGVSKTRAIATTQFKLILQHINPDFSEEEIAHWSEEFRQALNRSL